MGRPNDVNWQPSIAQTDHADVVVVGGGPAGVCAAVAGARQGADTVLVEAAGCLGGMGTIGLVGPIAPVRDRQGKPYGGLLEEVIERTRRLNVELCGGAPDTSFCTHALRCVYEAMVEEAGVRLRLHSRLAGVRTGQGRISHAIVLGKDGFTEIAGRVFVDATGDGDLAHISGAPTVKGAEPGVFVQLQELGLDQDHGGVNAEAYDQAGHMQPASLMFSMSGVDVERAMAGKPNNRTFTLGELGITAEAWREAGLAGVEGFELDDPSPEAPVPLPQGRVLFFRMARPGEVVVNMSRILHADGTRTEDLTRAELVGVRQALATARFLKRWTPGFERAYVQEIAPVAGVRETRRIVGQYVLTGRDAITCRRFDDCVARASYIIDIHDPLGKRKAIGGPIRGPHYDIPYRALLPQRVSNLLAAGRCVSCDHVAFSSVRVQGTCMLTGQAAGTAAAMALASDGQPSLVPAPELRERLQQAGVALAPVST